MALNTTELYIISHLINEKKNSTPRILFLGYPDIITTQEAMTKILPNIHWQDLPKRADAAACWKAHGKCFGDNSMLESRTVFEQLGAKTFFLDCIEWVEVDFIIDLNIELSKKNLKNLGKYDIIIDPGTIEHCFNIPQAFYNIHSLLNVEGYIYHQSALAFPNHGFWSISPTAFYDFYGMLGYDLNKSYAWKGATDEYGFEPNLVALEPFKIYSDIDARVASYIFQKRTDDKIADDLNKTWSIKQYIKTIFSNYILNKKTSSQLSAENAFRHNTHHCSLLPKSPAHVKYFPIQRCYSSNTRDLKLYDKIGEALGKTSLE